jgi:hypothetical protein
MAKFAESSKRSLITNVQRSVEDILDGYRGYEKRVSHWVQKDGIQNCWDSRKDELHAKKWKCEIELHKKGKTHIVTITDFGTYGLTGRRLEKKDLLKEQPKEERWARFENHAFENKNTPGQHLLGSRGRGKFVFSGASDTMTTMYETLRDDKVYRLGHRVVEKLDAPNMMNESPALPNEDDPSVFDDDAKDVLRDETNGILSPITHVGTRIIIMEPSKELVEDIQDGQMEQFISETWWEIIEKFGAKIIVKNGTSEKTVKAFTESLPCSTSTPTKVMPPKTSKDQECFTKESIQVEDSPYRIKKLYLMYDPNRTFDFRQIGISIQRAGMSICRFPTTELGTSYSDHITGYVVLEDEFERDLRKHEGPEHYSYNWNRKPASHLAHTIKQIVKKFATDQLGWKDVISAKVTKGEKKSNERAMNKANEIANRMGYGAGGFKKKKKKIWPPPPPPPPKKEKIVGIQLKDLKFPTEGKERVNYGQSLKGIGARIINNTDKDLRVGIKIEIISPDKVQVYGKYVFTNPDFSSKKNDVSDYQGSAEIKIEETDYSPGEYTIQASVALITPFGILRKGQELDTSKKSFFVEMNPPEGGIWEDILPGDFKLLGKEFAGRKSYVEGGRRNGTFILFYNKDHAGHKAIRSTDEKAIGQYKYCLTIPELCMLDLEKEWEGIITPEIRKKGPVEIYRVIKETEEKWTDSDYVDDV